MQTPEEFEWSLYQSMDHQMDDWEDQGEVHDLIRARDAEVRAEALEVAAHVLEGDTHVPDHRTGRAAIQFLRDRADQIRGEVDA